MAQRRFIKKIGKLSEEHHQISENLKRWRSEQWNNLGHTVEQLSNTDNTMCCKGCSHCRPTPGGAGRDDAQLACATKEQRNKTPVGMKICGSESEDEVGSMVCHMTGVTWEQLPFPIIIDSGACTSALPTAWCQHVPIEETKG